jgi:hypothetical protein
MPKTKRVTFSTQSGNIFELDQYHSDIALEKLYNLTFK